jgi:AbrB family looped-hinge helix DNA binding protein
MKAMPHYQAKMSSKGQLTIPAAVREHFNLQPWDIVDFYIDVDDRSVRIMARNKSISDYPPGDDLPRGERPATFAEMDEPVSEYLSEKDERISHKWRERLTIGSAGERSFFDGLDELKLPSRGRPITRADIDAAIDEEIDARLGRAREGRRSKEKRR